MARLSMGGLSSGRLSVACLSIGRWSIRRWSCWCGSIERWSLWRLFALMAIACIALLLWPDAITVLRWQRGAPGAFGAYGVFGEGQMWRGLSAHFAHLGPWHALANLAGMALVIELLGSAVRPAEAVLLLLASALTIIAGLAMFEPAVGWYAGLSGVVHGWWAGFAVLGGVRRQGWLPGAALGVLLLKLAYWPTGLLMLQQFAGAMLNSGTPETLPVVPQSHVYGAMGGAVAALGLIAGLSFTAHVRQCNTNLD